MLKLYDSPVSGNCYKVRLLLAQLGRAYEKVEVDVVSREQRPDAFLEKNAIGRIPILELDDGRCLSESNAILWYLARGTALLPRDPFPQAQVLRWMFFEQNNLEPNLAVARYWVHILKKPEEFKEALVEKRRGGEAALRSMERHLRKRR